MRVFIAQLLTETNTFTASPTGLAAFAEYGIYRGDGSKRDPQGIGAFLATVRDLAEADGHEVVESLCASAQPNGVTVKAVYEDLRDQILADLLAGPKADAVVLHLHGAMVAEGYDDCEGDLLRAVRAIVGDAVPVVVEIDLHCHFTEAMAEAADVVLAYQEYPHTDILSRARQAYRVAIEMASGRLQPTTAVHDLKMVGIWHTTASPLREIVAEMRHLEDSGAVVAASLGHGFPWGDVPESGAKLWVTTNDDAQRAAQIARQLGNRLWEARDALRPQLLDVDTALSEAQAQPHGTVVLADVADNAGGGAPGDSTFILQRVLERGIGDSLLGYYWDLGAIAICREAGEGARLRLRVGGKCSTFSGSPVDVDVTVRRVLDNHWQEGLDAREPLGWSVAVETDNGTTIVLASVRSQVFHPTGFTGLGIDVWRKRLVVVKSTHHFHAGFARDAAKVLYVSTPGALRQDFEHIPYVKRDLNYWPRREHPQREPG